ncbi:patatin-like phospholipase family protein [Neomegalonema sp.]|uniref:patatin-like phospholipase family protein n=1 Tax=Neomegalonema sp. TaxID=2039713 RepID=UPI0026102372|nr:patatin-like phospholipase family protein [Neomegalonema sp.]MDD2867452.1 patatin-like phospholipase family protein [Neomegalonema sp.]
MTEMRYCDLVMKGGVASGVVYPHAVLELAKGFRFKSIGGTSAGAIAAAATAAAALGDRRLAAGKSGEAAGSPGPVPLGFKGLEEAAGRLSGKGFLLDLFQPARSLGPAFRLIVALIGEKSATRRILAGLLLPLVLAPLEGLTLLCAFLATGFLAAGAPGLVAAAFPSLLCAYCGAAVFGLLRAARILRGNLLGLCSGLRAPGDARPALTEWMHEVLQELSGQPPGKPLVFGDLWSAPPYPDEEEEQGKKDRITLQMITTSVSHLEPRTLPLQEANFWFRRKEFDRLFPASVVDWMVERAGDPLLCEGETYHRFPCGDRTPVLVAMRMSLSYPLLLSAVPLHEQVAPPEAQTAAQRPPPAPEAPPRASGGDAAGPSLTESMEGLATGGEEPVAPRAAQLRPCWFTDGGVSSNFPIHLFDAPLPSRPTFAINLVYHKTDDGPHPTPRSDLPEDKAAAAVLLPQPEESGRRPAYRPIGHASALVEIGTFLASGFETMRTWRDLLQARASGQHDRTVQILLEAGEGGLNLDMPQEDLDRVALKGSLAGRRLRDDFSFPKHRWIRWRNFASALQRQTIRIAEGAAQAPAPLEPQSSRRGRPPVPVHPFGSPEAAEASRELLDHLIAQGGIWAERGPDLDAGAPLPLQHMKIVQTF